MITDNSSNAVCQVFWGTVKGIALFPKTKIK